MLISLQEMIKDKEDIGAVVALLSSFKCDLDSDLENFLYNKAIEFEKNWKISYIFYSW